MKCEFCGAEMLKGQTTANVPLSDGSQVSVLVSVEYCGECNEGCEIETELT